MPAKSKQTAAERLMIETDLRILEKSLAFHEGRIKDFGKERKDKSIRIFDNANPKDIIPSLKKIIADLKRELAK